MPELKLAQGSDEWKAARVGKITASVAAACLGLDPHTGPKKAWRMVMGVEPETDNKHVRWGQQYEAKARQDYEVMTGNLVTETGLWVHPGLPWLAASPDGLIGRDGLVELKCPSVVPEEIPVKHYIQVLIQAACTGRSWGDYFAWADKSTYSERVDVTTVKHAAYTLDLIRQLGEFYRNYVLTGVEPPAKQRRKKPKKTVHTERDVPRAIQDMPFLEDDDSTPELTPDELEAEEHTWSTH